MTIARLLRTAAAPTLVALGCLAGCQQKASEPALGGQPVASRDGGVKVVNAWCPVMDEHPVGGGSPAFTARPDAVREYKGMKVGFCCEDCVAQWDAMPEAEKAAALAKARSTPPPAAQGK
jgi:hypothetical protein